MLESRTIIVCLLVGTIVTLVGALAPAVRATRVAPVEALREASAPSRGRLARLTPILAGLFILGGAGLVIAGLLAEGGDTSTKLLGAAGGAVVLILGIALISPRFVGPAARVVAWPAERSTKLVGRLARENSTRHPGRTAVTSAALMIGLALVVFVTIFANGLRASVSDLIDRTLAGDIAVLHDDGFTPIPAAVVPAVAKVDGVEAASPIRDTQTQIKGLSGTKNTHAIDPATIGQVYNFDWKDGSQKSLDELGSNGVLLEETVATDGDFKVGDKIAIKGPSGNADLTVRGIYKDDALLGGITMGPVPFDELAEQKRVSSVLVKTEQGQSIPAVQKRVTAGADGVPRGPRALAAGAQGRERRPDQPAARALLRAAGDERDHLGVRDRQHAHAVDLRAHARARAAARGRHDAPRRPAHDPLRERHHRSVRRAARARARDLLRVRGDPGARERGDHVLAPGRADRLAADLRDAGGRGRRDLPCAPGVAARRPARDRLRVAQRGAAPVAERQLGGGQRPGEQVALAAVAAEPLELAALVLGLDPLGHDARVAKNGGAPSPPSTPRQ